MLIRKADLRFLLPFYGYLLRIDSSSFFPHRLTEYNAQQGGGPFLIIIFRVMFIEDVARPIHYSQLTVYYDPVRVECDSFW